MIDPTDLIRPVSEQARRTIEALYRHHCREAKRAAADVELFAERLADRDYMTSAGSDARNAATANHQRSQHLHELHTRNAEALAEVLGIDIHEPVATEPVKQPAF